MITFDTINKMAAAAHRNAVKHGFYDDIEDVDAKTAQLEVLLASEIGELVNADRANRWFVDSNMFAESELSDMLNGENTVKSFASYYEENVKHTAEEELADVVIRCLDTLGFLQRQITDEEVDLAIGGTRGSGGPKCWQMCRGLYKLLFNETTPVRFVMMIELIEAFCTTRGINLMLHVNAKMAFNSTRTYKHGKTY